MKRVVFCSFRHGGFKLLRLTVCLIPLLFSGCFEEQSAMEKSAKGDVLGISALSRFFTFGRTVSTVNPEPNAAAADPGSFAGGFSGISDSAGGIPELSIAMPEYLGEDPGDLAGIFQPVRESISLPDATAGKTASNISSIASFVLNTPFSQLFSSLFQPVKSEDAASSGRDDPPNPFTEARQKRASSTDSSASGTKADTQADKNTETQSSAETSKTESADSATVPSGSGTAAPVWFTIIGDFNGSGTLQAIPARRLSDTRFVSGNGEYEFNLYINSAAAEQQRSFCIEDLNGDGTPDLLVANRSALFGGVLFGDGEGGYRVADRFLTGYEPVVPGAGPFRDGYREILTVNTRTGVLKTWHADDHYRLSQTEELPFVPDYVLHLVAQDTAAEYLMAARIGGEEQILSWADDSRLRATAQTLPAEALVFKNDFGSDSLRAYQVGDYASIVLTSQGQPFNVANLHLFPRIFLVVGDLQRRGKTDVAVGNLQSFTPSQNSR